MKISVVPRVYFELRSAMIDEEFFSRTNIISLNAPSRGEKPPFPEFLLEMSNLLCLYFDDVSDPIRENGVFMTEEDADRIFNFLDRIDRNRTLFIHCTAGISRSGAVGEVLDRFCNCCQEHHEEDHIMFLRRHRHLVPNRWVRRIMLEGARRHSSPVALSS